MYTSPALLSILIYLALGFLYMKKFNEYVVLDNETQDIASITQGTFSVNNLCKLALIDSLEVPSPLI